MYACVQFRWELIGVTQLVNKEKQGEFPEYDPDEWPTPPEKWKASFNRSDQEFMKAFNIQAGVAIQNAKLFAAGETTGANAEGYFTKFN
jgi:adenylate cyclase